MVIIVDRHSHKYWYNTRVCHVTRSGVSGYLSILEGRDDDSAVERRLSDEGYYSGRAPSACRAKIAALFFASPFDNPAATKSTSGGTNITLFRRTLSTKIPLMSNVLVHDRGLQWLTSERARPNFGILWSVRHHDCVGQDNAWVVALSEILQPGEIFLGH